MPIGQPKNLTECSRFFREPAEGRHRQYEALRAYFVEARPSAQIAHDFGYSPNSFRVLCHHFRRDPAPVFFAAPKPGPRAQPRKGAARQVAIALRKRNYSVYEISDALKERKVALSPTAVREILKEEGFAPLPRRMDEERPAPPHPEAEAYADARALSLADRRFVTRCGGLFLFLPDLVKLRLSSMAKRAGLPGSTMIPAEHALRSCLALKLWNLERKTHVMALVADEGLALFSGLNVIPKKSFLSEYSSRIAHARVTKLLALWQAQASGTDLFPGRSFNLDFHSVPYYGEHPVLERHYVSARSRRQPSVLVFLAQDADARAFCYSNADLRKSEASDEILRFVEFWKRTHRQLPAHLVFDSQLTTHANLAKLDAMGIGFITLRRRSKSVLAAIAAVPRSAWRTVRLDVPTRKFRTPRVYEQQVCIERRMFRQLFIQDLGHEEPTVLVANDRRASHVKLITRYAQRMLIENALSDAVRFFHMDALSSAVGMKVDFDMALLVMASGLYRLLAARMRGYADAQARQIFRDLIDMPADVVIKAGQVRVELHRRAHLPIVLSSGLLDTPVKIPWWNDAKLVLSGQTARR
jgi:transposase